MMPEFKAGDEVFLKCNADKKALVDYLFIDGSHFVGRYLGETNQRTFRSSNFSKFRYAPDRSEEASK